MRSTTLFLPLALPVALMGCASAEAARYDYAPSAEAYNDDYGDAGGAPAGAAATERAAMEPPADDAGAALFDLFRGGDKDALRPATVAQARPAPAAESVEEGEPPPPAPAPEPSDKPVSKERLVIYTGSLALLVPAVEPSLEKFLARVDALGGYLGSRNENTVTVRVPAERFEALVDEVAGMGTVLSRRVQARDVTAQYRDLRIRIENAERSRQRLLALLERAEKMEDVLKIEAQLTRVTAELESMKGQLRLLADQIALSTLTVEFRSNAPSPRPAHVRRYSRFTWINNVGIENALSSF